MSRPDPVTREKPPCKDCPDRVPGCHGSCDRYKEWKQRLDELNKARKEYENKRNLVGGWMV